MCMHPVTDFGGALLLAHCQQVRFLCLAGGMLLSMKGWREARVQCQDLNKAANAKTYAPSHVSAPAGQVVTAPMYRRTLALIIDIVVGKAVNALCTLALKLASMGWGFVITDESAKAFGNGVQVLSYFDLFLRTLLSLLSFFFCN